jgi:hypothetical protein
MVCIQDRDYASADMSPANGLILSDSGVSEKAFRLAHLEARWHRCCGGGGDSGELPCETTLATFPLSRSSHKALATRIKLRLPRQPGPSTPGVSCARSGCTEPQVSRPFGPSRLPFSTTRWWMLPCRYARILVAHSYQTTSPTSGGEATSRNRTSESPTLCIACGAPCGIVIKLPAPTTFVSSPTASSIWPLIRYRK